LYAVRTTEEATIEWVEEGYEFDPENPDSSIPTITQRVTIKWPLDQSLYQLHIADTPPVTFNNGSDSFAYAQVRHRSPASGVDPSWDPRLSCIRLMFDWRRDGSANCVGALADNVSPQNSLNALKMQIAAGRVLCKHDEAGPGLVTNKLEINISSPKYLFDLTHG
jgi:hypothetical protein